MDFSGELHALFSIQGLSRLFILSLLELVLGVDNIIFISLLTSKVPQERRFNVRVAALSLAFIMRLIMLFCLVWLSRITTTLFTLSGFEVSIKDILFLAGGAYLTFNTIMEIAAHLKNKERQIVVKKSDYKFVILQIVLVDMLFSFDSIFTAIGINPNFIIMALAVGVGMICMIFISGQTTKFIERHPDVKTVALGFIILVGLMLIAQSFHFDIPKIYLYGALVAGLLFVGIKLLWFTPKEKHNS